MLWFFENPTAFSINLELTILVFSIFPRFLLMQERRVIILTIFFQGENCDICVQQSCRKDCTTKRAKDVAIKKMFYKIARSKQWHLPLLNQTMNDTLKYFMFDEFDAHHFSVYFVLLSKSLKEKILLDANQRFAKQDFTTYEQYFQVPAFFKKALKVLDSFRNCLISSIFMRNSHKAFKGKDSSSFF